MDKHKKSITSCGIKARTVEIPPIKPLATISEAHMDPPALRIASPKIGPNPWIGKGNVPEKDFNGFRTVEQGGDEVAGQGTNDADGDKVHQGHDEQEDRETRPIC